MANQLDHVHTGVGRLRGVTVRVTIDSALYGPEGWRAIMVAAKRAAADYAATAVTARRAAAGKKQLRSQGEEAELLGLTREGLYKWRRTALADPPMTASELERRQLDDERNAWESRGAPTAPAPTHRQEDEAP